MNNFARLAALGAVLAASAPLAFATPISGSVSVNETVGGSVKFDNNSIVFNPDSGRISNATGTTSVYQGLLATLSDFTYASANGVTLFTVTDPSGTLAYTLTDANVAFYNAGLGLLDVTGDGVFSETGYADTAGTFLLTASDSGVTDFEITSTAAATPEPNSLLLMGTGLLGAAGLLVSRRRNASNLA